MYKCINEVCANFNHERNPGGRLIVKEGKVSYSGSKCTLCGQEMEHFTNSMPNILNIKNPEDGRNL